MKTTDIVSTKLASTGLDSRDNLPVPPLVHLVSRCGWGTAMGQRTFRASAVAFLLGLVISLVWSFLHTYGF